MWVCRGAALVAPSVSASFHMSTVFAGVFYSTMRRCQNVQICSFGAPCRQHELWFYVRIGQVRIMAGCCKWRPNQELVRFGLLSIVWCLSQRTGVWARGAEGSRGRFSVGGRGTFMYLQVFSNDIKWLYGKADQDNSAGKPVRDGISGDSCLTCSDCEKCLGICMYVSNPGCT